MIKIENVDIVGWEAAIRGMRNPMNSWDRSDSDFGVSVDKLCGYKNLMNVGEKDLFLMSNLSKGGPAHAKYRRTIVVYADITAPLYWWKEFDTYKVGTVANSCSTMHKIHAKEFTLDDFSHEHLGVYASGMNEDGEEETLFQNLWIESLKGTIFDLNVARRYYNREIDPELKKAYWWQMIQLLPSSYNQKRTVMLNYEVLNNIRNSRANHKLDEWREFCKWTDTLPYIDDICPYGGNDV